MFTISVERRGTPEAFQSSVTVLLGWLAGLLLFRNQYKIVVTRFHPSRKKPLRTYKLTRWSIKGYNSLGEAQTAAPTVVQRIELGEWDSADA